MAVGSFRMWLWIDERERPLVAVDTGDEQQQVGAVTVQVKGALLPHGTRITDHGAESNGQLDFNAELQVTRISVIFVFDV